MAASRRRPLLYAVIGLVLVWLLALAGYELARKAKVTPDEIAQLANSIDLNKLSPAERARILRLLAEKYNRLTPEDRRGLRPDRRLFDEMTDDEKEQFIEDTMPNQIKQAINAFENLPDDRRQKVIDNALNNLRNGTNSGSGPGGAPLTPELEAKVRTLGLKTFYKESSAETKAELAPLLNELQSQLESGRFNRRGPN